MQSRPTFYLTDAVALLPLVRQLLVEVRESRCRLHRIRRELGRADLEATVRRRLLCDEAVFQEQLTDSLSEAQRLGLEITPGVRCQALFPFLHQWVGAHGDGRLRPAYFAYSDEQDAIAYWYFAGWPNDQREIPDHWWKIFRQKPAQSESVS